MILSSNNITKILLFISTAFILNSCEPAFSQEKHLLTHTSYTAYVNRAVLLPQSQPKYLGVFKATAYCSCKKCCGKSDGITASGKKAKEGTIACNWLPFGTKLRIAPRASNSKIEASWHYPIGTVLDRGAKSILLRMRTYTERRPKKVERLSPREFM